MTFTKTQTYYQYKKVTLFNGSNKSTTTKYFKNDKQVYCAERRGVADVFKFADRKKIQTTETLTK